MAQNSLTARGQPETGPLGTVYTTQEVATMLKVAQRTVQDWIREGALPAMRYGKLIRIREADLVAFGEVMSQRTDVSPSPTPAGVAQE
jgi:excisionase family DNA binding protein